MTGLPLKQTAIRANFQWHKYQDTLKWLPLFIFIPFLEEDSINGLAEKHGSEIRKLYYLIRKNPEKFEEFVRLLTLPVFFGIMKKFESSNETERSRNRVRLIIDDTGSEKFGKKMEMIHKMFDPSKKQYIMGYNYVFFIAKSGNITIPLSFLLWLPKGHPDHLTKNDIAANEILRINRECEKKCYDLKKVEFVFDSAYCVQKVIKAAQKTGITIITKPKNNHKFKYEDMNFTPKEIYEKTADLNWKYLCPGHEYQRVVTEHTTYGRVVLTIRRRTLKNGKMICDVVMCDKIFYTCPRIHVSYKNRWEIEMQFKYYKQYLSLGKLSFGKTASIRSALSCTAIAGLIITLFRRRFPGEISFREAVKLISRYLFYTLNNLHYKCDPFSS